MDSPARTVTVCGALLVLVGLAMWVASAGPGEPLGRGTGEGTLGQSEPGTFIPIEDLRKTADLGVHGTVRSVRGVVVDDTPIRNGTGTVEVRWVLTNAANPRIDAVNRAVKYAIHTAGSDNGVGFTWGMTLAAGTQDAGSVAAHELGHELGMEHSAHQAATMKPTAPNFDRSAARNLSGDDVLDLRRKYPTATFATQTGSTKIDFIVTRMPGSTSTRANNGPVLLRRGLNGVLIGFIGAGMPTSAGQVAAIDFGTTQITVASGPLFNSGFSNSVHWFVNIPSTMPPGVRNLEMRLTSGTRIICIGGLEIQ